MGIALRLITRSRQSAYRPWHIWVNLIAGSDLVTDEVRQRMYLLAGLDIRTSAIRGGSFFGNANVSVGEGSMIGRQCYFDPSAPVRIGRRCFVAAQAMFATSTHEPGRAEARAGPLTMAPIDVQDGCWIGARATLLPGVRVGAGCVVAAGSVVTESCEPQTLYAGVPAVAKRALGSG